MGPTRVKNDPLINKTHLQIPGPGDYKSEQAIAYLKEAKLLGKVAFKSNVERFKVKEPEVPGPGNYDLSGAVTIRSESIQHASFRSGVKKEL